MDFKPIRNKIRKHTFDSLVFHILELLRIYEESPNPSPFWHPLLLLKWTLEFAEQDRSSRQADRKVIKQLLDVLEELEMAHPTFNLKMNGFNLNKTFTILSFQQMQYQEYAWTDTFERQVILYDELKHKYDIAKSFYTLTGIPIFDFIRILFFYWMIINNENLTKQKFTEAIFQDITKILTDKFGGQTMNYFFALLTVSRNNIKQVIDEDKRLVKDYNHQIFEPSLFTRKPFLRIGDHIFVPYKDLFTITVNHFIYDYLKNRDDRFTTELGARMERYVKLGISEVYTNYETENDLRRKLGKDERIVDFVVEGTILIEVKAIELKPYIGINPTDDNLAQEFKGNIAKAYAQQMLNIAEKTQNGNEFFGMIITYKRLYVGNTTDLWDSFLKQETEKLKTPLQISYLPIENVFLIDIRTWDKLIQILKDTKISLREILVKIRETDKNPTSKKNNFDMHLDDYSFGKFDLTYLQKAKDRMDRE